MVSLPFNNIISITAKEIIFVNELRREESINLKTASKGWYSAYNRKSPFLKRRKYVADRNYSMNRSSVKFYYDRELEFYIEHIGRNEEKRKPYVKFINALHSSIWMTFDTN